MGVITESIPICDVCDTTNPDIKGVDEEECRDLMKASGVYYIVDGKDLCEECYGRLYDEDPQE